MCESLQGKLNNAVIYPELESLIVNPSNEKKEYKPSKYGFNNVIVNAIQSEELNIVPSTEEQIFEGLYDTVNVEAISPIEAETLNATSSTQNQSFTGLYDEVNIAGIQTDTLNVTPSQTQQQFTGLYDTVNVGAIQAETLNVTPTKEAQTRTGLYNQVNVSGDNNLVAGNIKKNVSIFGVTGSYEETPNLQSKSVTITENGTQTVSPDTGYDGLSSVSVTTNVAGSGNPYKRLEYIESTGTQYINTGITPDNTTEFEIKYNQTAMKGQYDTIIGGQQSNTGIFVMPTFNSTVYQKSLRYNTTENKTSTTNSYYQVDTTLTLKQNVFTFDNGTNQESITTGSYSSFSVPQSIWLFALNNGGTAFGSTAMKLYYCKIWKNNELVRDLIPIRMVESGNVGLWDKVNQEFLSNAGLGTFTAGAVLPDEDEWYIDNAAYLFTEGSRLNSLSNLLPLIKNATTAQQMFNACRNAQTLDLTSFDTTGIKYMNEMFQYCTSLTGITIGNKWNMSSVTDTNSMFYNCTNLTYEGIDWSKFDTSNVTNSSMMFGRCEKLVTAPALNLSSVTSISGMFSSCYKLKNVPAYSIPNATSSLYNMFQSCSQLTEESLNNILAICISATKIPSGEKRLQRMGITSAQATTCQGLSNYQAFLDAGWTTGY